MNAIASLAVVFHKDNVEMLNHSPRFFQGNTKEEIVAEAEMYLFNFSLTCSGSNKGCRVAHSSYAIIFDDGDLVRSREMHDNSRGVLA